MFTQSSGNTKFLLDHTYSVRGRDVEENFSAACDWLKELGLFPNGNRYAIYAKTIRNFARTPQTNSQCENENEIRKYNTAIAEVTELIRIYDQFQFNKTGEFIEKLKQITSGEPFRRATKTDPGREYVFELSIAARFLRGGYTIDLTTLTDLIAYDGIQKIYVESKRIQSPSQVKKRLAEAHVQIKKRMHGDLSPYSRGITLIHMRHISSSANYDVTPQSRQELRQKGSNLLREFASTYEKELAKMLTHRQLGVVLECDLQGLVYDDTKPGEDPMPTHEKGNYLFDRNLSAADHDLFRKITANISAPMPPGPIVGITP